MPYATGSLRSGDTADYYKLDLSPGDIIGAAGHEIIVAGVQNAGVSLVLRDSSGAVLVNSAASESNNYPDSSPLPRAGRNLAYVIDTAGTYYISVEGNNADYILDLSLHRPALERQPIGSHQILYLDFDGANIDLSDFGGTGNATLSPLSATTPGTNFLTNWGLSATDENAVIDSIIATVEENLSTDMRAAISANGDFDASGVNGEFDIRIANSRDDASIAFGQPNVSRIVVGGTLSEFPLTFPIGLAQSIDIGNFDTEETAVVLLDLLSNPNGDQLSLNQFDFEPGLTAPEIIQRKIELVGTGVGNIVSHEAGHLFGVAHTDFDNATLSIGDASGSMLENIMGLVGDYWGDSGAGNEEIDVDFVSDTYLTGLSGTQNSLEMISYGLSTGKGPAPQVIDVKVDSDFFYHLSYSFATATHGGDPVTGSGLQLATVPVGGANIFTINFSEPVNVAADDLDLIGLRTGDNPDLKPQPVGFMHTLGTNTASWWFENLSLNGDQYVLQLSDSVTNLDGIALDGEWINPSAVELVNPLVSTFPSGDGTYGGDFEFVITLMPGDANLDLVVDVTDLGILATYWQLFTYSFELADFNGDGIVNVTDLGQFASNNGLDWTSLSLFGDLDGDWDVDADDEALAISLGWTQEDIDIVMEQFGIDLFMAS